MASINTKPATLAACGPRKNDLLAGSITSDITNSPALLQAAWLSQRFNLSTDHARLVAELAFRAEVRT